MRQYLLQSAFFVLCSLLFGCNSSISPSGRSDAQPEKDTVNLLMQLQECSKLYSSEYLLRKFVIEKSSQSIEGQFMNQKISVPVPSRSRRIAIPVNLVVKGYIDMSLLRQEDIRTDGQRIQIILPDPKFKITSIQIDRDNIVQDADLLRPSYNEEKIISLVRNMVNQIHKELPKEKFMETAKNNAAYTLFPLLQNLGFKEIQMTYRTELTDSYKSAPLHLEKENY